MSIKIKFIAAEGEKMNVGGFTFDDEHRVGEVSNEVAESYVKRFPNHFEIYGTKKVEPVVEKKEVKVESYETKDVKAPAPKKAPAKKKGKK